VKIAHLTDLHVSKYGARMTMNRSRTAKGRIWESFCEEPGWRIEIRRAEGIRIRDAFRLVDSEDRVHRVVKVGSGSNRRQVLDELRQLRDLRMQTDFEVLARKLPNQRQAIQLLQQDPDNGNLRFCLAAHALRQDPPDWVVVTGDLTDDGIGYELLKAGLAPFIEKNRLLCIPGNHDIYPTPPVWNDRELRTTEEKKRQFWNNFTASVGMAEGSFVHDLGENVVLARLDSCTPSRIPGSASGFVAPDQVRQMEDQLDRVPARTLRLACMHHPVVKAPYKQLGLSAYQPGMRLRNSRSVFRRLREHRVSVVMHGHRHVGYNYQTKEGPVSLSAPSTTYGCRTGARPFYWCLVVVESAVRSIQPVPIPGLVSA